MMIISIAFTFLLGATVASSLSLRSTRYGKTSKRETEPEAEVLHAPLYERLDEGLLSYLEKRRGGGGSGGGGGGRGGSSGSSSSGSSGSSGSSSGSSSGAGRSGSSGNSGSSSGSRNTGTASSSSSIRPAYGGGRYYGGGSTSAYRPGARSPIGGILPFALAGAALGFFPGLWLYGAYEYNYNHPYNFHNRSDPNSQNQSLPVTCLCDKYSACGCDDTNNSTFLDSVVGNGSLADQNSTLVHIGNVNGTKTIILNGTLPNGTDTENSTDDSTSSTPTSSSSSGATRSYVLENAGFWLVSAIVSTTIWLM